MRPATPTAEHSASKEGRRTRSRSPERALSDPVHTAIAEMVSPHGPTLLSPQKTEDMIREAAYAMYEREGCIDGRALDHWLKAEAQVRHASNSRRSTRSDAPSASKR